MRVDSRGTARPEKAYLVIGLLMGALLLEPAVGHVSDSLRHFYSHADQRYQKRCSTGAIMGFAQINAASLDASYRTVPKTHSYNCRNRGSGIVEAKRFSKGRVYVDFGVTAPDGECGEVLGAGSRRNSVNGEVQIDAASQDASPGRDKCLVEVLISNSSGALTDRSASFVVYRFRAGVAGT